ncbi:MAG: hypothetical protein IKC09_04625 [Oscillospiraceae bacterium]|nr:hypothetical protein [Oscillospiraceae bacterium]
MDNKKIRAIGAGLLLGLWLALTVFAWIKPADATSDSERRPLDQFPELSVETVLDGKFMTKFEDYTLDQFPLRDTFRQLKSMFHYFVLNQGDNNDIYIADGYAAKLEYPLNQVSLDNALKKFNAIYDRYLKTTPCKVYAAVVPDKSYYLAEENGYLAMDYADLFAQVQAGMPWASYIDLTDTLSIEDYYRTDTHWRQEKLIPAAQKLAQAMGGKGPVAEDFTVTQVDRPFYGVYYGQAALPMASENLYLMESDVLKGCRVKDVETGKYVQVYNPEDLDNSDLYDIYLGGAKPLMVIENPNAKTNKELIVFRDSFGSSMIPLLVQDYRTVTVVDIRYINSTIIGNYVRFRNQDVLFLYSSLVLNSSAGLQ